MKTPAVILVAAASGAAAAAVTALLLQPVAKTSPAADAAALDRALAGLERVEQQVGEMRKTISAASAAAPSGEARVSDDQIDRAVARWMAANASRVATTPGGAPSAESPAAPGGVPRDPAAREKWLADAVKQLLDPKIARGRLDRLFEQLRAEGLLDDAIALMEQNAEDRPNDPASHMALSRAYIQKIFDVKNDMEKGTWAMKADATCDHVLTLDPQHWEARFSKATGLSFWPPIMGKGPEAVKHFEILVKQQEATAATNPEYAQTYVFLGNLYAQQGKHDLAASTWQKGFSLFPENPQLQQAAQGASGK